MPHHAFWLDVTGGLPVSKSIAMMSSSHFGGHADASSARALIIVPASAIAISIIRIIAISG